jgi:hypothetical protein
VHPGMTVKFVVYDQDGTDNNADKEIGSIQMPLVR